MLVNIKNWNISDGGIVLGTPTDLVITDPNTNADVSNQITDSKFLEVSWTAVADAVNYRVFIYNVDDFTNKNITTVYLDETTDSTKWSHTFVEGTLLHPSLWSCK